MISSVSASILFSPPTEGDTVHGPDRRAVGGRRRPDPKTAATCGQAGASLAGPPRRASRNPLGAPHGSLLEGSPRPLASLSDLSPSISAIVPRWHAAPRPGSPGRGPLPARPDRPPRSLRRRHLRGGQRTRPCVGKTKRGKGTKIMAVADRSGLPIRDHARSTQYSLCSSTAPASVRLAT